MKKLALLTIVISLLFIKAEKVKAVECFTEFSGNVQVTENCTLHTFASNVPGRNVSGIDFGSDTTNVATLTISSGTVTINSNETLAVGSINLTNGSIAIAEGAVIEIGKPIWMIDQDADGRPVEGTMYVQSAAPTNGRRISAMGAGYGSSDCDDTNAAAYEGTNFYQDSDADGVGRAVSQFGCVGYPPSGYVSSSTDCNDGNSQVWVSHSQCYTDADGDGYTSGAAANTSCLNTSSCATATRASTDTHGAAVTAYSAGVLRDAATAADCRDSVYNASNICYIIASGGTVTTSGNYRIHTFTSSGTFSVSGLGTSNTVEYLIVAGGGGGGYGTSGGAYRHGGGGGAGGLLTGSTTVSQTSYGVTVGAGGGGAGNCGVGATGGSSSIAGLTAVGGGGGGGCQGTAGAAGGSGGGAAGNNAICTGGGAGTSGQGNAGGSVCNLGVHRAGAGGGGRGGGVANGAGPGGVGLSSSISGAAVTYAAGGPGANRVVGTANRGNGGGGGVGGDSSAQSGAPGGSGIVIVRYIYQ